TDVFIDTNTFFGNTGDAAIDFSSTQSGSQSNVTISNNLVSGNARAVFLLDLINSGFTQNTVTGSTQTGAGDIRIFGGVSGLTVANNLMQAGAGDAIKISDGLGSNNNPNSNISLNDNSISGYGGAGIDLVGGYAGSLDASNNWWGSATGPTTPSNPGGSGQTIVDPNNQVVFSPYLTSGTNTSTGPGFQPPATPTTGIALSGTGGDDTLVVFATGTDSGVYSLNGGALVPFINITRFSFAGLDGNDTFTINNPAGGLFAPADGIDYDGGSQNGSPGDALNILGGSETTATYTFTTTDANGHSGSVALVNGSVAANYMFTGLEPLTNAGNTVTAIFNLPA